jgi:phosphate transport system substrate-binding protein
VQAPHKRARRIGVLAAAGAVVAAVAATAVFAAADAIPLRGTITADGSSTVGPWTTAAAELFGRRPAGVRVTVGISGTGGGFERFCKGETDLSNASRPIKNVEHLQCLENGVRWLALTVANDALTVVVNREATWVDCLTTAELRRIWDRGSKVDNWRDVRPGFPSVPLKLYGPGTDSGTFDFFTEVINGKSRQSRSDYFASEDDNALVQGVAGDRGGMGYFGFSYYDENRGRLKAVRIDGGKGCVAASAAAAQRGVYKPLARPLFIYAKRSSFRRAEVRAFLGWALNNQKAVASRADFIPLTATQFTKARASFARALKQIR